MSYEKVKSISYNKKTGVISITSACSNLRPLYYSSHKPDVSIYEVFQYIISGGLHLAPSLKKWVFMGSKVESMYKRTEEYKTVVYNERAKCPVFQKIVDKVLKMPYAKLAKLRYKIKINGDSVTRFGHRSYWSSWTGDGKDFDFVTVMTNRERYKDKYFEFKRVRN